MTTPQTPPPGGGACEGGHPWWCERCDEWHDCTVTCEDEPSTSCEDLCMVECIGACGVLASDEGAEQS